MLRPISFSFPSRLKSFNDVPVKPFVRYTALFLAILFLSAAAFAWFDVLTHDNVFTNPELKIAAGWLTTGLMLLALALRGRRARRHNEGPLSDPSQPPR
jgi:hypothetical protein